LYQFFSRPDRWLGRCGDLRCEVVRRGIPGAPGFLRGLRALFIADVHIGADTREADIAAFADRIAAQRPDLLLWGGDYSDRPEQARRLFDALRGLQLPLGSFAVVGNNDREAWPDPEALRDVMGASGIRLLLNESATVPLDGGALVIAGVDEHRYGAPDARNLYPATAGGKRYRVLLSHYPVLPASLPDLMLSGHTHGGQFNLLGCTPYTFGFERVIAHRRAPRYIAGLHRHGGAQVFVSKGVGASRIPLRIGVRPEIDLLTFE